MVAGLGAGLAGAMAIARVASTMLFGVSAFDPVTTGMVAILILTVGVAACLVPAWRATRVDPLIALADIRS
jgi:ABC-type antimicrobial peptide transport system permease subunit